MTRTLIHRDIEMRHTDIDMLQDDPTVAKDMTVDSMTVRTMDSWQDKNRGIVPQRQRILKICLFGNDTLISMLLKF